MINSKLIYKILGQLLFIEAFLLFVSLLVAFYYQQDDIFAFIVATLTTIGGGLVLKWRGHGADNSMSRRDAYLRNPPLHGEWIHQQLYRCLL